MIAARKQMILKKSILGRDVFIKKYLTAKSAKSAKKRNEKGLKVEACLVDVLFSFA
jgi:hypothetical protein